MGSRRSARARIALGDALPGVDVAAPGHYRRPFSHQTLLASKQLAAYVHFPQYETSGIAVEMVADFDTVPPTVDGPATIEIGAVVERDGAARSCTGFEPAR